MGLDSAPSGDGVTVSIQYLNYSGTTRNGAGGGGSANGQGPTSVTHTASANTAAIAIQLLRSSVAGSIFLGTADVVFIGSDVSRTNGINSVLDFLMRQPVQPTNAVAVLVDGKVTDFLSTETLDNVSLVTHLAKTLQGNGGHQRAVAPLTLFRLFDQALNPLTTTIIPIVGITKGKPAVTGVGILKGDRLATIVSLEDVPIVTSIVGSWNDSIELPPLSGSQSPIALRARFLKSRASLEDEYGTVHVRVSGQAYVEEGFGLEVGGLDNGRITSHAEAVLEQRVRNFLQEAYSAGLDVANLGEHLRRKLGSVPPDWGQRMHKLKFQVEARIVILHGLRGA